MWYRIYTLVIKEILAIIRDPKSRIVLILPPLIQLLIYSQAATLDVSHIRLAVLNQDRGTYAYELEQRLSGSPYFTKKLFVSNLHEVQDLIDHEKVLGAIHIKEDFSRRVSKGQVADVQVLMDGRNSNASQIVIGYLNQIVGQMNVDLQKNIGNPRVTALVVTHWFNPNLIYAWYTVPCLLGILLTIMGVVVTGLTIAREREMGTLDQLLVSPLRPVEILLGKTIPSLIFGLLQGTLLFLISLVVFQIPFSGSVLYLYTAMTAYLLSVIGIGLFISSISATQQQAILGAFVFTVPAVLLSGFATPVENMPAWLQFIGQADPIRHFLVAVKGIFLKDMPWHDVVTHLMPLVWISVVTMSLAVWFFKKRVA